METIFVVIGITALVVVAARLHTAYWVHRLTAERPYDEVHFARTDDGWRLALHRYRGPFDEHRPPIILCHGIAANRYNLDLDDEHSLARYLHQQGRDVWLLELRGRGWSDRPCRARHRRAGWSIDDLVRRDVPAAIACVREATGAAQVDWVGFSLGGIVQLAHLGCGAPASVSGVRRLVTIGSALPLTERPQLGVFGFIARIAPFRVVHTAKPARLFAFVGPALMPLGGQFVGVRGSTAPLQLRRAMACIVSNISRGVLWQFDRWFAGKGVTSRDGVDDYGAGLAAIQAPTLLVAGVGDRLASPRAVQRVFERLTCAPKDVAIFGREHGHAADYGHIDLAFGRHAPAEVYPRVASWLGPESDAGGEV